MDDMVFPKRWMEFEKDGYNGGVDGFGQSPVEISKFRHLADKMWDSFTFGAINGGK